MTQENDIVLVYLEDKPLLFARIEKIIPDIKRDWYQVKLLFLQIPLQAGTWILRDAYIDGDEFTMGGKRMRLERIVCPDEADAHQDDIQEDKQIPGSAKVISLVNRMKSRG